MSTPTGSCLALWACDAIGACCICAIESGTVSTINRAHTPRKMVTACRFGLAAVCFGICSSSADGTQTAARLRLSTTHANDTLLAAVTIRQTKCNLVTKAEQEQNYEPVAGGV